MVKNEAAAATRPLDLRIHAPCTSHGSPGKEGDPASAARASSAGSGAISFEYAMSSVSAGSGHRLEQARSTQARGAPLPHQAFTALLRALGAGQAIGVIHRSTTQGRSVHGYELSIQGRSDAATLESARANAEKLQADLIAVLAVAAPELRFSTRPVAVDTSDRQYPHSVTLRPAAVAINARAREASPFGAQITTHPALSLPLSPSVAQSHLTTVVPLLNARRQPTEVHIGFRGRKLTHGEAQALAPALEQLFATNANQLEVAHAGEGTATLAHADIEAIYQRLSAWRKEPFGADLVVSIHSDGPIPEAFARMIGLELLQGRPFGVVAGPPPDEPAAEFDLSRFVSCADPVPPLLPPSESLAAQGLPRHFESVRFDGPKHGIVLGDIPMPFEDQEVRFSPGDRDRHCYVTGATGTGKSTLLSHMIRQDIANGEGVALLDPHGDLFAEVLASIPPHRHDDVVVVDFADFLTCVGLNLLECSGDHIELERGFAVNELLQIFRKLYAGVPESMGPAFEQYFRYSVALLMHDPAGGVTIVDIPRVFTESDYRRYLLAHCDDDAVHSFWVEVAENLTGDWALAGFAAYVTNKLTEFIQNPLVRAVVGQSSSTIDCRTIMDDKKILLVNLSKGMLSERDAQFLGMIVLNRLLSAALSRADIAFAARTPFHLYIDEFQNFTTGAAAALLAEARKYGLRLVLAHQNLGQVPDDLLEVIHANTGTKILMRSGVPDAHALGHYVAPGYAAEDLVLLPDGHAFVRMQLGASPAPCFFMRTRSPEGPGVADEPTAARVRAASRRRYNLPREQAERDIRRRRFAYLARIDNLRDVFSARFAGALSARGVERMDELRERLTELERDAKLRDARNEADRKVMRKLHRLSELDRQQAQTGQGRLPLAY